MLRVFLKNSEESLKLANKIFSEKSSWLWVIVISYYAMYYIANAVLYKHGYKIGSRISHKVTADALIVFVRNKLKNVLLEEFEEAQEEALEIARLKSNEIIESFDLERRKRSKFQYEMTEEVKMSKAKTSLERAKRFCFELRKLVEEA
ncbi:MAG TPA: HEPN domain-containing protein [Candidatus Aenigmarchaeota archaeon]|nr:HEPN domain-containing protein [Candidatus Aenigmarchaeota archaeon]